MELGHQVPLPAMVKTVQVVHNVLVNRMLLVRLHRARRPARIYHHQVLMRSGCGFLPSRRLPLLFLSHLGPFSLTMLLGHTLSLKLVTHHIELPMVELPC